MNDAGRGNPWSAFSLLAVTTGANSMALKNFLPFRNHFWFRFSFSFGKIERAFDFA